MNLVDPRYFKQDSGVGEWVDAMVRFEGTVVNPLAGVLIGDWILESGEPLQELIDAADLGRAQPRGTANVQIVPSGPGESEDGLLQMILGLINAAQHELILTTPYLVPDDPMIMALRGAAGRGVQVTLIVPESDLERGLSPTVNDGGPSPLWRSTLCRLIPASAQPQLLTTWA